MPVCARASYFSNWLACVILDHIFDWLAGEANQQAPSCRGGKQRQGARGHRCHYLNNLLALVLLDMLIPGCNHTQGLTRCKVMDDNLSLLHTPNYTATGRFDALDEEVLLAIMSRIPFLYRLACTTSVCKPWRSLRDHISLWTGV